MTPTPPNQPAMHNPEKSLWVKVKEGSVHSWHWFKNGSILFKKNFQISKKLLRKKLDGDELNYKEHSVLVTTTSDLVKLIPFSFFVIVPFAELLLPVVIKIYPKILPSTYDVGKLFKKPEEGTSDRSKRLLAKQKLMEFFKEVSIKADTNKGEMKRIKDRNDAINEFKNMLVTSGAQQGGRFILPDVQAIKKFISNFPQGPDYFRLENLKIEVLESMCFLLNIDPFAFRSHIVIQLKRFINEIRKEDKAFKWEGLDSMSPEDLVEANRKRGLPMDVGPEDLKSQLREWIEISSNRDIPISVLLWIRAFVVSENAALLELATTSGGTSDSTTGESNDSIAKIRVMSDELVKRISDLEKIEYQLGLDHGPRSSATVPLKIDEQISVVKQQIELLNKELLYLNRLKRRQKNKIHRN